jgi:hypothetical protein
MASWLLARGIKVAEWLKVGISIFTAGAVLELLLAVVAIAKIESPTSHTWVTLTIAAMLLLITGLLVIYISRQRI